MCSSSFLFQTTNSLESQFVAAKNKFLFRCLQDRLSFIGPEEFIQTFAMNDPLENHKVALAP